METATKLPNLVLLGLLDAHIPQIVQTYFRPIPSTSRPGRGLNESAVQQSISQPGSPEQFFFQNGGYRAVVAYYFSSLSGLGSHEIMNLPLSEAARGEVARLAGNTLFPGKIEEFVAVLEGGGKGVAQIDWRVEGVVVEEKKKKKKRVREKCACGADDEDEGGGEEGLDGQGVVGTCCKHMTRLREFFYRLESEGNEIRRV